MRANDSRLHTHTHTYGPPARGPSMRRRVDVAKTFAASPSRRPAETQMNKKKGKKKKKKKQREADDEEKYASEREDKEECTKTSNHVCS